MRYRDDAALQAAVQAQVQSSAALHALKEEHAHERRTASLASEEAQRRAAAQQQELQQALDGLRAQFLSR